METTEPNPSLGCPCCGARYLAELARLNQARDLAGAATINSRVKGSHPRPEVTDLLAREALELDLRLASKPSEPGRPVDEEQQQ